MSFYLVEQPIRRSDLSGWPLVRAGAFGLAVAAGALAIFGGA